MTFAAAALVGPGGRVNVSDVSEAMVEAAERRAAELGLANVECRVLDAERLDLAGAAVDGVDGVVCTWGYMLMGDPAAALRETRRVLRRGGRLSCAVFAGAERNPWAALPSRVLQERGHRHRRRALRASRTSESASARTSPSAFDSVRGIDMPAVSLVAAAS